jgi:peptidoglycan hydrolase CwlO-like protein
MADNSAPTKRTPPANVIIPQKKVEVWDQTLATITKQQTTIAAGIEAVAQEIDEVRGKIDNLQSTVVGFGVVLVILAVVNIALRFI